MTQERKYTLEHLRNTFRAGWLNKECALITGRSLDLAWELFYKEADEETDKINDDGMQNLNAHTDDMVSALTVFPHEELGGQVRSHNAKRNAWQKEHDRLILEEVDRRIQAVKNISAINILNEKLILTEVATMIGAAIRDHENCEAAERAETYNDISALRAKLIDAIHDCGTEISAVSFSLIQRMSRLEEGFALAIGKAVKDLLKKVAEVLGQSTCGEVLILAEELEKEASSEKD